MKMTDDAARQPRKVCGWHQDDEGDTSWATSCGKYFVLNEGTPLENEMVFCPYCGQVLQEEG
jgi:hypothetical protein